MELLCAKSTRSRYQRKNNLFACQEFARKGVERCFGVLQSRWSMIAHPCRLWSTSGMADVMYACIIMHNMIIEDEADANLLVLHAPSSSHTTFRRGITFNTCKSACPTCKAQIFITLCVMIWFNICGMREYLIINRFSRIIV